MQPYDSRKRGAKGWRDKTIKLFFRWFGSTHQSPTKDRITRNGRKRARQEARNIIEEDSGG